MDIRFDDNIDTANAVKRDLDVFVVAPIAHASHIYAVRLVFLVTFDVLVEITPKNEAQANIPSARTTSRSREAASFLPVSDSCQEL